MHSLECALFASQTVPLCRARFLGGTVFVSLKLLYYSYL
nr:MAG TPA: hypothetical protein [Caudoviricetes sp.]